MCVYVSHSVMSDSFETPWIIACQAPLSLGLSRQEYWSGLPFPLPGDLPNWGMNRGLLHGRQILYRWATRKLVIFSFFEDLPANVIVYLVSTIHWDWEIIRIGNFFFNLLSQALIKYDTNSKITVAWTRFRFCLSLNNVGMCNPGLGFPGGSVVKNLPASAGDMGSIPGPGRSHMLQSN